MELTRPMPNAARSRGSSCPSSANAKGKTPPATPMITRPATTAPRVPPAAAISPPSANRPREMSSTGLRPNRSPSRPAITVSTADEMKKPVTTHAASLAVEPVARWISARTGTIAFCDMA